MFDNNTLSFLEKLQTFGWKLNLENIYSLLVYMDNPHVNLKCVHIAGTNGKGSTSAFLESILRTAGYKTGLFTSPHLVEVNERIRVNGVCISDADLTKYMTSLETKVREEECTYFETLTAIAFRYFCDCKVDFAVIEVGLGGRFDATNVVDPVLSIITEIDFDHEQYLGADISSIAKEKAGIIKKNRPCLVQTKKKEALVEFKNVAREKDADFFPLNKICNIEYKAEGAGYSKFNLTIFQKESNDLLLNIPGKVQVENAALAVSAVKLLENSGFPVSENAILNGLKNTLWPGRLQIIQDSSTILLDVAHNVASIKNLLDYIETFFKDKEIVFVLGLLGDKNRKEIVNLISFKAKSVFVVTPASSRATPANELTEDFQELSVPAQVLTNFSQILDLTNADDLVCITGSHYVVGDFLKLYKKT